MGFFGISKFRGVKIERHTYLLWRGQNRLKWLNLMVDTKAINRGNWKFKS